MEFWDLYDENRQLLPGKHRRGAPLKRGEYHIVVFVWIFNGKGELLLMKRSPQKKNYPNLWAATGGAVLAGETSLQAVARELREETGIRASEFRLIASSLQKKRGYFCDIYLLVRDVPLSRIVLQKGETCAARWVNRARFEQMIAQGEIAPPDVRRYAELDRYFTDLF